MSILDKHLPFVNEQITFHKQRADNTTYGLSRRKRHLDTADKFSQLVTDIESVNITLDGPPGESFNSKELRLSVTLEDIEGLPEELLEELSVSSTDRTEFAILSLLQESDYGILSLDQVLVGLYQNTGEILKRQTLTSKLYRMAQNRMIFNVPGKKGAYSVRQLTKTDTDRLFGDL